MSSKYINLGCGKVFVDSSDWWNLDFAPATHAVRQANLLGRLPVANETASIVYSSHFLEHVPRSMVPSLLKECLRVMKPGGVLRLVVPDLENLAREYLALREAGEHDKADFLVLELLDQCVRRQTGGELGQLYRHLTSKMDTTTEPMIDFIRVRTGEDLSIQNQPGLLLPGGVRSLRILFGALRRRIERCWIRLCLLPLPASFRSQNVSLAAVGERHQWVWDFHQIKTTLEATGFVEVQRRSADTSVIIDFPYYPLDLDTDGCPRKGAESMYVEARKPTHSAGAK